MIFANSSFIKNSTKVLLSCSGVAPFTWEVIRGDGSVSTVGDLVFYKSPNTFSGSSTIRCTDSNGQQFTKEISHGSALMVVLDVIRKELNLDSDQIHLAFQKNNIANNKKPYIIGRINPTPYANNRYDKEDQTGQVAMINGVVTIDILGFTNEVHFLAPRIIMAINSRYSERQQEINAIKIYKIPNSMNDISMAEGPSGMIRYNMTFNLNYSEISLNQDEYFENIETNLIVRQ